MSKWWRKPRRRWWRDPALKADDDDTGAIVPPGRGDFEQIIQDRLTPVFDVARERALVALTEGDQFDEAGLRDELIALFLPVLTDAVIYATNEIEGQLTLGFDIETVQSEARTWARQRAEELADQLIATTRGLLSELEPEEVESALERAFGAARRLTIGQSETTDAMSAGALLFQRLARALEVFVDLIWYTREDEKVCIICFPLHNKGQAVWSLQFPTGPKAHVKCRCGLRAEVRRRA